MKRLALIFALLCVSHLQAQLVIAPTTAECATSIDGTVVGTPNPLGPPQVSAIFTGTLPAGNYFVQIVWYDAATHVTLPSPEVQIQLTGTGELQVQGPVSGAPSTAVNMEVFIGTTSGGETFQGSAPATASYVQSIPLVVGSAVPTTNNTLCQVIANDAGWPTGTGYVVTLTTPSGNTLPGYPMQWQLLGPGNTINLSQGLPFYNGTVQYPSPILSVPYGHGPQSISGNLSLGNYNLSAGSISGSISGSATSLNGVLNPASCGVTPVAGWCSGSDIGAWSNAAITQLPATPGGSHCGTVYIPAGNYNQTTTIVKPRCVKLDGAGAITTNIQWTGAAGSYAIVSADTTGSGAMPQGAIEDLTLTGITSGSGGIFLGGDPGTNCGGVACIVSTASGDHQNINRVRVNSFAVGVAIGNNVYSMTIFESALYSNTSAISVMPNAGSGGQLSGESMVILASSINNNTSYAIYMPFAGFCPAWCWELTNDSFDTNGNGTTAPIQTGFVSTNSYFLQNSGPIFDTIIGSGWVEDYGSTFTIAAGSYFGRLSPTFNSFTGSVFDDSGTANTDLFNFTSATANYSLNSIVLENNAFSSKGNTYRYNPCVSFQKPETGAADSNVLSCLPNLVPGTTTGTNAVYRISISIAVGSATSGVIGWTATWTDANGNAQAPTELELFQDGTAAPALTFTTSSAGGYHSSVIIDVNNANANIVIKWIGGGTTAARMSATIERLI